MVDNSRAQTAEVLVNMSCAFCAHKRRAYATSSNIGLPIREKWVYRIWI